jgi:plasmid stability protein
MPTLTVEDMPSQLYETLTRRASEARRSVSEEAKQILADTLGISPESADSFRLPDLIPSDEILPPCDLPIPGQTRTVEFRRVAPPLPDPLVIDEQAR